MFCERLTQKDIELFCRQNGYYGEVILYPEDKIIQLGKLSSYMYCKIIFSDKAIHTRRGITELQSGDWQVFMRQLFGDEYMDFLKLKDIPNNFVDKISIDDLLEIVPFYKPYLIEECTALQKGTRRFKVRPTMDAYVFEVVIGPRFTDGNITHFGASKKRFEDFMHERFGDEYSKWLLKMQ